MVNNDKWEKMQAAAAKSSKKWYDKRKNNTEFMAKRATKSQHYRDLAKQRKKVTDAEKTT